MVVRDPRESPDEQWPDEELVTTLELGTGDRFRFKGDEGYSMVEKEDPARIYCTSHKGEFFHCGKREKHKVFKFYSRHSNSNIVNVDFLKNVESMRAEVKRGNTAIDNIKEIIEDMQVETNKVKKYLNDSEK